MRILAIRGQNLASLQRPFEIRLDRGPLGAAGLFAIVGPVGAGKSTLLDALCLPLFDRTPRLSGRGGVPVGDDNQPPGDWLGGNDPRVLLRRGAPEGFAEVEFLGRDGEAYLARWHVRRARRKADGRVQDQELSLHSLPARTLIASGKKTEVLAAIQARLGLDFAQFCRSVLLAQGDFAAFLRANAKERAQLLETLTGADVYRALSRAAHEKRRNQQQVRENLLAEQQAQPVLDAAERGRLETRREGLRAELAVAEKSIELAQSYVNWYQQAARHAQRESAATVKLQAAQLANTGAEPERRTLARLQRALPVAGKAALVADRRARLGRAEGNAREAAATAEAAAVLVARTHRDVQQALGPWRSGAGEDGLPPAVRELASWRPVLVQWSTLRRRVEAGRTAFATADTMDAAALREQHAAALVALGEARQGAEDAEFATLAARQKELEAEAGRLAAARAVLTGWHRAAVAAEAIAARQQELTGRRSRLLAQLQELAGALREAQAALVAAQQDEGAAMRSELASQLAEHLHDGQPCPVCGSGQHPAPAHFDAAAAAAIRARVAEAQARFGEAQVLVREHEKECVRVEESTKEADARAAEESVRFADARREFEAVVPAADPGAGKRALAEREVGLQRRILELQAVADRAGAARRAVDAAALRERQLVDRLRAAEELARRIADLDEARQALAPAFVGVQGWEQALAQRGDGVIPELDAIAALVEAWSSRRRAHETAVAAAATAAGAAVAAQQELAEAEAELVAALQEADVAAAEVEHALRLGAAGLAAESARLQGLASAESSARAVLQQCAEQRREHERGGRPTIVEDDASAALDDARSARSRIAEELEGVQGELIADDLQQKRRAELLPRLQAIEASLRTWMALDDLIGSSDGSAFAVFAQSLTLDFLLVEANRRLQELARRYRLEKSRDGELDFVVVDLDLGGARRSLQTLSGGETFLVSLSLALALATLAAPRSRVETLFLDEGFGTLDGQSLEAALGALDSLQATGCQVGIISHVDGIAERIGAVVEVLPEGGGRSRVVVRGE